MVELQTQQQRDWQLVPTLVIGLCSLTFDFDIINNKYKRIIIDRNTLSTTTWIDDKVKATYLQLCFLMNRFVERIIANGNVLLSRIMQRIGKVNFQFFLLCEQCESLCFSNQIKISQVLYELN